MIRRVLIVDDELDIQSSLSFALKDEGYEVQSVSSPKEALQKLEEQNFHVALFDVWFPEGDGVELLKASLELYPAMSIIMMSGHGNIELALKSIRMGAYDFLEKPLELEKVLVLLRNACETSLLKFENQSLMKQLMGSLDLVDHSPAMKQLSQSMERVAPAHSHVLLLGESGVGRTLIARLIHMKSERAKHPFVTIHCASLTEDDWEEEMLGIGDNPGRLEFAKGGTIYFNGLSEMPVAAQARLFRILEEKRFLRKGRTQAVDFDARIIASAPKNVQENVDSGMLREDLFFLLKVVAVEVPPLRDRAEDIADLSKHFIKLLGREYGRSFPEVDSKLIDWMKQYDWPGNVREMKNLLERCLIMSRPDQKELTLADLPEDVALPPAGGTGELDILFQSTQLKGPLRELRSQFESLLLQQRLSANSGNVTKTAESLGIERAHLHRKMKQLGFESK
ncbi:sigma-54-dependent Fis family transcriptional regulator [bacterium]|nr:sigma-54-dependent Fis family transcriptional regulator [bacterium]